MPSMTHDGRGFMVDGRRIWLVSGRIPYARLARESWADRIHQAKLAGLNTIETPIFWNRHETRPGRFDFAGDNDLRHFVDLVGKAGLFCILGMGPYVGAGWDMGGLPPWLTGRVLRTNHAPYLEACSRFISAVADQIKGWQITAPGTGGPIVLLQCENAWTCGHEGVGQAYLGELTRYIREAGLNVPIVNANNLWLSVEGQVDGWSGEGPMLGTMRQLAAVRPDHPRVVVDLSLAPAEYWGGPASVSPAPARVMRRLAEVAAGAAQFNLSTFAGGTNFGFLGGRLGVGPQAFATTSAAAGCVIDEAGRPTALAPAVRLLAGAISRFARVFSHLDPAYQPIAADPAQAESDRPSGSCAVVHASGSQGGVVFVFGDEPGVTRASVRIVSLLLPDGSTLGVPVWSDSVAWCLLGVSVGGKYRLDYSNLSTMGFVGQVLVLFGPAGSRAMVSINGSPMESTVPEEGAPPAVLDHEGLTLVVLNDAHARDTFLTDASVFVGVAGVTSQGAPVFKPGYKHVLRLDADGSKKTLHPDASVKRTPRVALGAWTSASCEDYLDGTSPRYAAIAGPTDLATLGSPYGYGWYRLMLRGGSTRRATAMFPGAGDRLHFFAQGKRLGLAGVGPGASESVGLPLRRGESSVVVLAENAGRFCEGVNLGEAKGLTGEGYEVRPMRTGRPTLESGKPIDVLEFRAPLWELSEGDATSPERVTWKVANRKRLPVLMRVAQPPAGALLLVNDKPAAYLDRSGPSTILLPGELWSKGVSLLQVAPVTHGEAEGLLPSLARGVRLYECVAPLLDEATLSFAKWEMPGPSLFAGKGVRHAAGTPHWWRSTFDASPSVGPLFFEPAGLSKGQFFVNGRHVGRYFVSAPGGKRVGPQSRYLVPASWLKAGENELTIFDEHGASPGRVRLAH